MAAASLLAPTASAATSTSVACPVNGRVVISLYTAGNVPITERIGATVLISNTVGDVQYRDNTNHLVVLTSARPEAIIEAPGTYKVVKSPSTQAVGVWADAGV